MDDVRLRRRLEAHHVSLTLREWEVVQLVWQGRSTREIAERLFISTGTVRTHLASVCHKLGIASSADLLELLDLVDDRQVASGR
ncbi:MAG TPA: helix-turn-helix transcriptional regulator [Acidimicrobiales bacterium]